MDQEAIKAAHIVKGMTEQHFEDGYYSSEVRAKFDTVANLSDTDKQTLYGDTFNQAQALVYAIAEHPRYNNDLGEVDLTEEGFGIVHISADYDDGDEETPAYHSVEVMVESFNPVAEAHIVWDEDPLGGMAGIGHSASPPSDFEDGIYLNADGTMTDPEMPIDPKIMKALDFVETLTNVQRILAAAEVPA